MFIHLDQGARTRNQLWQQEVRNDYHEDGEGTLVIKVWYQH